jgi:ABC-type oligopeptide transport system substrate-binding subunit
VIQGASRLLDGQATDLSGFHILSPGEFTVDLEKPVPFFPAMISYAATAIVPEGTAAIGRSPREDAIGTGPFRLVSFEPGRRLELERNPNYWRAGRPLSDGVVFHFGVPPEDIRNEFLAGRLSIARDLLPADAEAFRHDPRFASGYRESPRLTTYFVAFNAHRGPFQDAAARRSIARGIRVDALVRRTLGRLAIPAHGLLPPGLLGYSAAGPSSDHEGSGPRAQADSSVEATVSRESVDVTAAVHPGFFGEFAHFFQGLDEAFRDAGLRIRPVNKTMAEYLQHSDAGDVDLDVGRWTADYPDSDTFFFGALHSASGAFRNLVGNADIDRLSEQARVETDPRVRHSLYRQGEELIAREALMLPLFHDQVYCFARPELEGLTAIGQSNSTIAYEDLWIKR